MRPNAAPRGLEARTGRTRSRMVASENTRGAHIFVRPYGEHQLTLLDDLTSAAIVELKHSGFARAVVVETSLANFQAWQTYGKILSHDLNTYAARNLAPCFGSDPSSADWRHFGRLAGFTNQKEKRRLPNGRPPFVNLHKSSGRLIKKRKSFLVRLTPGWNAKRLNKHTPKRPPPPSRTSRSNRSSAFHVDMEVIFSVIRAVLSFQHGLQDAEHYLHRFFITFLVTTIAMLAVVTVIVGIHTL